VLSSLSDDDGRVLSDDQASHLDLLRSSLSARGGEARKREEKGRVSFEEARREEGKGR